MGSREELIRLKIDCIRAVCGGAFGLKAFAQEGALE